MPLPSVPSVNKNETIQYDPSLDNAMNMAMVYDLTSQGYSPQKISKLLRVSPLDIILFLRKNPPSLSSTMEQTISNLELRVKLAANAALDTIIDLLGSRSDMVRLKASTEIMDRAGLVVTQQIDNNITIRIPDVQLQALQAALRETDCLRQLPPSNNEQKVIDLKPEDGS